MSVLHTTGRAARRGAGGFTLVELTIALVLIALMASVLYGALGFAGTSMDKGEAKAEETASMRLAEEFLRTQIAAQHPLRMRKVAEFPLLFGGTGDELRYAAPLPPRVAAGGIWYYRLRVARDEPRSPLVLDRMVPDVSAERIPTFDNAERSVLAQDIAELHIAYLGRPGSTDANANEPQWLDRWENTQQLPKLLRIEIVPKRGPPWPTLVIAPREAPEAGCRAFDPVRRVCVAV